MSVSDLAVASTLVLSTRAASESILRLRTRDKQTPARISSLIHALLCSAMLWDGKWGDAVMSTGVFFVLDFCMTFAIEKRMETEMIAHHVLGALLCLYSFLTGSAEIPNVGLQLTRSLILMETTNPLLHTLILLRKEKLDFWVPVHLLRALQVVFLAQFFLVRIVHLGLALWNLSWKIGNTNDFEKAMLFFSSNLWILQWVWLFKLMRAAK
jgi:hypothetical protein